MSSSNSPCAACKFLRRKCTQECVFAPYFPPDQPQRFSSVHKVFGASNVAKLLNELPNEQREDAVNSLAYEAEARLRDPVYGCVGMISILQQHLKKVQGDIYSAKKELSTYIGPSALLPMIQLPFPNPNLSPAAVLQQHYNMSPLMAIPSSAGPSIAGPSHAGPSNVGPSHAAAAGGSHLMIRDPQPQQQLQPQNQQYLDAQQLAALAVTDQQQQQQQHQQQLRFHGSGVGGYEGTVVVAGGSSVSGGGGGGFNQAGSTSVGALLPSSALGAPSPFDQTGFDHEQQIQPQQHQQQQPQQSPELQDGSLGRLLLLQQPATPQQQQLGHGDIAVAQGTTHHHEQNHHQQQGSRSQSHHHQNLLLQLQHQREHIQHQQQQQRDDGID